MALNPRIQVRAEIREKIALLAENLGWRRTAALLALSIISAQKAALGWRVNQSVREACDGQWPWLQTVQIGLPLNRICAELKAGPDRNARDLYRPRNPEGNP